MPAGQLRAVGGELPLGGGGVQRGALLDVLHALAELQGGAIAGDPLGLEQVRHRIRRQRLAADGPDASTAPTAATVVAAFAASI